MFGAFRDREQTLTTIERHFPTRSRIPDRLRIRRRVGWTAREVARCAAVGERVLEHRSFHNYADYALSEPFQSGFTELRRLGHARHCAIMCAEAVWWRCHRRIIADYLIARGEDVLHILGANRIEPAHMTGAVNLQQMGR